MTICTLLKEIIFGRGTSARLGCWRTHVAVQHVVCNAHNACSPLSRPCRSCWLCCGWLVHVCQWFSGASWPCICFGASHGVPRSTPDLNAWLRVQADTELKRLAAENEVLLRQVRDLENRVTLTTREISSGGQPAAVVCPPSS